jgi:hypothetical protein
LLLAGAVLAATAATAALAAREARAQGFEDRTGAASPGAGGLGRWMLAFQVGHPLVGGLRLGHRFDDHVRAEVGGAALSDFAAIAAAARLDVVSSRPDRAVPFLTGGLAQYFIAEDGGNASPLGLFGAGGLEYIFPAGLSVEVQVGVLKTFGTSDPNSVRRFAIEEDDTRAFLNIGGLYYW